MKKEIMERGLFNFSKLYIKIDIKHKQMIQNMKRKQKIKSIKFVWKFNWQKKRKKPEIKWIKDKENNKK